MHTCTHIFFNSLNHIPPNTSDIKWLVKTGLADLSHWKNDFENDYTIAQSVPYRAMIHQLCELTKTQKKRDQEWCLHLEEFLRTILWFFNSLLSAEDNKVPAEGRSGTWRRAT